MADTGIAGVDDRVRAANKAEHDERHQQQAGDEGRSFPREPHVTSRRYRRFDRMSRRIPDTLPWGPPIRAALHNRLDRGAAALLDAVKSRMTALFDTNRTSRHRRTTARWTVLLCMVAVLAQSSIPWLHAVCADALDCGAGHSTPVLTQPPGVGDTPALVGHAAGHAHRGTTHDAATCTLCRTLQHTTVALAPVTVAAVVPLRPMTPDGSIEVAPPRDAAADSRVPRAPPARA